MTHLSFLSSDEMCVFESFIYTPHIQYPIPIPAAKDPSFATVNKT